MPPGLRVSQDVNLYHSALLGIRQNSHCMLSYLEGFCSDGLKSDTKYNSFVHGASMCAILEFEAW